MSGNYKPTGAELSNELSQKLKEFLSPLENQLSGQIDHPNGQAWATNYEGGVAMTAEVTY